MGGARGHVRRPGAPVRLRPRGHADLRAPRGVPAGRRVHRRRAQGDVRLRATRAAGASRCAPRGRRRSCARSCSTTRRSPWKVWYVAPNFRYERPQKGRYRQHYQVGAEVLGVDDPDVDVEVIALGRRLLPRASGCSRFTLLRQLDGRRRRAAPATSRRCASYLLDHGDGARAPTFRERVEAEPAARPRLQARRLAGRHRARAADHRLPQRRVARALRGGPAAASTGSGIALRDRAPARARLRLLHPHHVRVPAATRSTRRRTRSAAAVATTGSPRRWAGRPRRASASASASSGC